MAAAANCASSIVRSGVRRGLRLVFSDQGPGIADIARAMSDGYHPGGGLGLGLGGAKRLCNEFDIRSAPGEGTTVAMSVGNSVILPDRGPERDWRSAPCRRGFARESGAGEADAGRVALVATEMASNLLKHAGGGEIAMQRIADGEGDCIELVAFDSGPGIADTARAMEDGFSRRGQPRHRVGRHSPAGRSVSPSGRHRGSAPLFSRASPWRARPPRAVPCSA